MRQAPKNPAACGLRAVYTVSELAAMAGVSKKRMLRRLRAEGVRLSPRKAQPGVAFMVCLCQLKQAWPDLWDSLVLKAGFEEGLG